MNEIDLTTPKKKSKKIKHTTKDENSLDAVSKEEKLVEKNIPTNSDVKKKKKPKITIVQDDSENDEKSKRKREHSDTFGADIENLYASSKKKKNHKKGSKHPNLTEQDIIKNSETEKHDHSLSEEIDLSEEKYVSKKKKSKKCEVEEPPKESDKNDDSNKNHSLFYVNVDNNKHESKVRSHQQRWLDKEKHTENDIIVPLKESGRIFTVSIAIPVSILEETCLRHELRTYVIGQIARAACIYSVDEIVVYNDQCWTNFDTENIEYLTGMMKMILEYQECPQYLRKHFFPMHPFTSRVGILNALNAPHHLRYREWCDYREGITSEEGGNNKSTMVDVGLRSLVQVDSKIIPGVRVTVKFPEEARDMQCRYGTAVSPAEPRAKGGLYWGYTVRMADSLSKALKSEEDDYDLIIGTSDRGALINTVEFQPYKRALIVFGGVHGLEEAINNDVTTKDSDTSRLFHHYINTCPDQASRTIRTEEAVLITLSALQTKLFNENEVKI